MKTVKKIFYVIGVLLGLAFLVLLSTGLIQVGMGVVGGVMNITISEDTLYSISGTLGIAIVGILFAAYVGKKKRKSQSEDVQAQKFNIKKALLYGVLAICICHVLFSAVTTLLFAQVAPMGYTQSRNSSIYMDILCGVILAPIGEELLFRSGLYSLLKGKLKGVSAIVLCALIFGVVHGYNALGFVSCCLAGVVFTVIYAKTGNVWYSILTHGMCNLHSLIFNAMEQKGVTLLGLPVQYEVNGYNMYHVVVIVAAVVFCAVVCLHKNYIDNRGKRNVSNISCG